MSQNLPEIIHGLSDTGESGVVVVEGTVHDTVAGLVAAHPTLSEPSNAGILAAAANHIARLGGYGVIGDPKSFETEYRARVEAEDPSAPWRQGDYKLSDYGLPDFSTITAPAVTGTTLVFFARDAMIGLPYRVEVDLAGATATYAPLALTPLPPVPASELPGEDVVLELGDPDDNDAEPEGATPDFGPPVSFD